MDRRQFLSNSSMFIGGLLLPPGLLRAQDAVVSPANPKLDEILDQPLRKIAFGSCNHSHQDQSYWRQIGQQQPDLWLWLGDTIYGDGLSMAQRRTRFQDLKNHADYAAFRQHTAILGTWDDHDYASDNQDGSFADKISSKAMTLNFLDTPPDSPVWARSGIYQSYEFGPAGQRTKVILLDLRFNMDRSKTHKTLLGAEQWRWLESELQQHSSDLLLIGSSLNVTSPNTGLGVEGWNSFPNERQHLYDLIAQTRLPTILLSGDRHYAEFSKVDLPSGQAVYEFMSSGLTHSAGYALPHPHRLAKMVGENNFGVLQIDWAGLGPVVRMEMRSPVTGEVFRQHISTFG